MSWQGYLQFVYKQKEVVQRKIEHSLLWEAQDILEKTLLGLLRTREKAKQQGMNGEWTSLQNFFQGQLQEVDALEQADKAFYQSSFKSRSMPKNITQFFKSKPSQNTKTAVTQDPLQLFQQGQKTYQVILSAVEELHQKGKVQELIDFILQALNEADLVIQEQAHLNFILGENYLKLKRVPQARQAFWKVRRLNPEYQGLEQKLAQLENRNFLAKSRHHRLLEQGSISQEQLDTAFEKSKKENQDVDQILIEDFKVSKNELGKSLSTFYQVDFVPFSTDYSPPFEIFEKRRLDPDFLKKYGWVPLVQHGDKIEVLMANPYDLGRLDEIRFILGTSQIETKVSLPQDIEAFVDLFFKEINGGEELSEFDEDIYADTDEDVDLGEEVITEQDSEVVRLVNALLMEAYRQEASDIHIEPNPRAKYCSIRFRVDGTCHEFRKIRYSLSRPLVSRIKIMSNLDIAERRLPQDGKVKIKLPKQNRLVEFRIATVPTVDNQEDVVMRVLASGKPLPLDQLGLAEANRQAFEKMIYKPFGLVLVVGPTGSGKTTTLHSAVSYINTVDRKIWTAEDPVEITQDGLRQVQIAPKIGLTFAATLRSFLRADPDVILIGEMRDKETAHIGVESSLTGHLVFSTLHTNSAPETITRLLDMDLDPFNFADSLLCVLAQRLVKTLCPKCKQAYTPTQKEWSEMRKEFGEEKWDEVIQPELSEQSILYKPQGCRNCIEGYKGRIGVHELMTSSEGLKNLIKFHKPTEELRQQAVLDGMLSLKQDGILKVIKGIVNMHQVRIVSG